MVPPRVMPGTGPGGARLHIVLPAALAVAAPPQWLAGRLKWEVCVRGLTVAMLLVAAAGSLACRKTAEGDLEVERPVVGTQTDTINTPSVDVGTRKARAISSVERLETRRRVSAMRASRESTG